MRTNIDIDDRLLESAMSLTGLKTKRETVELALQTLVTLRQQEAIKAYRGKLSWVGSLDELREGS
ncbi:MAG: type II toxin-antitoxin system VapB family antitoxin [Cyanobacteria bacterium J06648_11]